MKKQALTEREDVLVAGIGGAGVKIVGRLRARCPGRFRLVAMDTDERTLSAAADGNMPERVLMGAETLHGAGAGGDPEKGRNAASEALEPIRLLLTGRRVVVCVAGVGGGTGTGALPVVLRAAHELGAVTIGLVTLPFSFEGRSRSRVAEGVIDDLRQHADALAVVSCDRLFDAAGGGSATESFANAEDALAGALVGVAMLLGGRSYLGADILHAQKMVREHDGVLAIGFGEADGRNRAAAAAKAAVESPLLKEDQVLARAPAVMVSIVGSDNLQIREADAVMRAVAACVGEDADVCMGIGVDAAAGGLSVTIMAMEPLPQPDAPSTARTEPAEAEKPAEKPRGRRGGGRSRGDEKLRYDVPARERFKGVEPTVLDGEDLDAPTFIRRGIKIVK